MGFCLELHTHTINVIFPRQELELKYFIRKYMLWCNLRKLKKDQIERWRNCFAPRHTLLGISQWGDFFSQHALRVAIVADSSCLRPGSMLITPFFSGKPDPESSRGSFLRPEYASVPIISSPGRSLPRRQLANCLFEIQYYCHSAPPARWQSALGSRHMTATGSPNFTPILLYQETLLLQFLFFLTEEFCLVKGSFA